KCPLLSRRSALLSFLFSLCFAVILKLPLHSFHLFVAHDRAIPIRAFQIVHCRNLHRSFRSIWIRNTECKNIVHESTCFSSGAHCYFDLLGGNVVQYEKGVHIRNFKLLVIAHFGGDEVSGPTSTE